jgi:transcriptional regulator with XRE-family HTH domain
MMESKTPISDAVRKAVERSGLSRYEICKRAGIDQAAMSRFMAGKTGLTTTSLDALADVLGLRIVADGPVNVLPAEKPGRKKGTGA